MSKYTFNFFINGKDETFLIIGTEIIKNNNKKVVIYVTRAILEGNKKKLYTFHSTKESLEDIQIIRDFIIS